MSELNMSDSDAKPCPSTTNGVSVGDKLRCKESSGSGGALRIGEWHTVTYVSANSTTVCVVGSTVHWELSRFDLIIHFLPAVVAEPNPYADWKSGDSVRCLDATEAGDMLAYEHIYEIDNGPFFQSGMYRIRLVGLPMHTWHCNRFERVAPIVDVHSEPDKQADQSDVELMHADEARRLADEHFMANGLELRLAIKAAIDAAVAKGESSANIHMSDSVYTAAERWVSKRGYSMSIVAGFTWRIISWE